MTDSTALVTVEPVRVELGVIRADKPAELVQLATEAANALASVIESRKLFSVIQGKKFVRCEGWTTLAAMLGVTPHEISVTEVEGAFTATVELRRLTDGQPVSRASAECGPDESTWKGRARYARRSMALTRATAKACRLAFSWIMALSGYEVTPAEEIPHDEGRGSVAPSTASKAGAGTVAQGTAVAPAAPGAERVNALATWKGKPIKDFKSDDLVTLRNFLEKKNPDTYGRLIGQVNEELASRQGE